MSVFSLIGGSLSICARAQGGVFLTGHDPDFHAIQGGNPTGAKNIIKAALNFTTNNHTQNILLVTDLVNPGDTPFRTSDPRLGLTSAGYTFDVADDGLAGGIVKDLHTVNFSSYNAVVIASDFGGWLRQSELDILNSRSNDILTFINHGGGLVALAESGSPYGLTTHGEYGYIPFIVTKEDKDQNEVGNKVTSFGATLGLTNSDLNGNASHNVFTSAGGLNIVDIDPSGQILSLAYYGTLGPSGPTGSSVPEPGSLAFISGLAVTGALMIRRRRKQLKTI